MGRHRRGHPSGLGESRRGAVGSYSPAAGARSSDRRVHQNQGGLCTRPTPAQPGERPPQTSCGGRSVSSQVRIPRSPQSGQPETLLSYSGMVRASRDLDGWAGRKRRLNPSRSSRLGKPSRPFVSATSTGPAFARDRHADSAMVGRSPHGGMVARTRARRHVSALPGQTSTARGPKHTSMGFAPRIPGAFDVASG